MNLGYLYFAAIMTLLATLDLYFIHHAYYMTLMKGASVQLVFGFEVIVTKSVKKSFQEHAELLIMMLLILRWEPSSK